MFAPISNFRASSMFCNCFIWVSTVPVHWNLIKFAIFKHCYFPFMSGPLCLEALHNAQQTSRWKLKQMNATKPNLYLQEFADLKTNLHKYIQWQMVFKFPQLVLMVCHCNAFCEPYVALLIVQPTYFHLFLCFWVLNKRLQLELNNSKIYNLKKKSLLNMD